MAKARIMIVEDETIVALDIRQSLERGNYEVIGIYSSAEEALEVFRKTRADLALMDIRLQGKMDGVEAADILRRRYDIPVILLTAYADEETIERAKLTEPFGYIIKPFEERDLKTTIEIALYRHELSKKLKESEERYRRLFEDDLSGDFVADRNGTVVACNQSFVDLLGIESLEAARGLDINTLFPDSFVRQRFWQDLHHLRKLKLYEISLRSTSSRTLSVLANVVGYFDESGEIYEVKGYLIDTTERKRLETQLRQAQKMEAVGRLAGGIAHDFNNLLTVIIGYSSLIEDKAREGKPVERDLEGIQTAARKATALTKQLLAFSKRQILNPVVINMNDLVRDLDKMLRRLVTEDIVLTVYTGATSPYVLVDPSQVEQSLINLVVNARDAMPKGGRIVVECKNVELSEAIPGATGDIPPGHYLRLSVTDTGVGIETELLAQIFEPFFTTKTPDKGTGLGLSTVFGIIDQSHGYVEVHSEIGKGSTFILYFPVTGQDLPRKVGETGKEAAPGGSETVLVVEDEDAVRALVSQLLTMKGYRVLEASNPGEALLIYEKLKDEIDLLISDIVMPHMDGHLLSTRLRNINPDLKIILMSGYPAQTLKDKIEEDSSLPLIQKPFEANAFMSKVRQVLDAS